jgi:hypothetical protein
VNVVRLVAVAALVAGGLGVTAAGASASTDQTCNFAVATFVGSAGDDTIHP